MHLCEEMQDYLSEIQITTKPFHEMLFSLMQQKGWSEKELCEKCLLDRPRFTAIKHLDDDAASTHNVTLQVLVALCIGMQLNITVSEQLLALRGYALSKRNPIHNAYRYLIERCSGISIDDANELLTELFAEEGRTLDLHSAWLSGLSTSLRKVKKQSPAQKCAGLCLCNPTNLHHTVTQRVTVFFYISRRYPYFSSVQAAFAAGKRRYAISMLSLHNSGRAFAPVRILAPLCGAKRQATKKMLSYFHKPV